MKRRWSLVACVLFVVGCLEATQERVRFHADDGKFLYRRGMYAEAGEQFRAALQLRPNDPDLLYNFARCRDKQGRTQEALQLYERVLVSNPDHLEARHALYVHQVESGQRDQAEQLIQQWLQQRPSIAGPYVEDGWLRARDGDLDSARGRFQQALDLEPRNTRALNELAKVYERLYRPERAFVLYERSLEADPDQPDVQKRLDELRAQGVRRPRPD